MRIYTEKKIVFFPKEFSIQSDFIFFPHNKRVVKHIYITRVYKYTIIQSKYVVTTRIDYRYRFNIKTQKTTKFYTHIYMYIYIYARSTPSIHVIFIEARPENKSHAK